VSVRVYVRARVRTVTYSAVVEGWVYPADWLAACDECSVRVHVERVVELSVRHVSEPPFPPGFTDRYIRSSYSLADAERDLRAGWLSNTDEWALYALGRELRELRPPGPPEGAQPLF